MQTHDAKTLRRSVKIYRRLLALEPGHTGHREKLAELYIELGRRREGIAELVVLAQVWARSGMLDKAIAVYRYVLALEPGNTDAGLKLAKLYARSPRVARQVGVVSVAPVDPLAEMDRDAPLDAAALVAVHSPDDLGVEVDSLDGDAIAPHELDIDEALDVVEALDVDEVGAMIEGPDGTVTELDASLLESVEDPTGELANDRVVVLAELETSEEIATLDIVEQEDLSEHLDPLPRIPLFSELPRAALLDLVRHADRVWVDPDGDVPGIGTSGGALFVVIDGHVRLMVAAEDGTVELGVLGPGDVFGEYELLTGQTARMTVHTPDGVDVLILDGGQVATLQEHFPAVARGLDELFEERLVLRFLTSSPLFCGLNPFEREALARRFHPIALADGEALFSEGRNAWGVYLVARGRLGISRDGVKLVALGPGDFLGVVSALTGEPATATATAAPDAEVLCLDAEELDHLLTRRDDVRDAFSKVAQMRRLLTDGLLREAGAG